MSRWLFATGLMILCIIAIGAFLYPALRDLSFSRWSLLDTGFGKAIPTTTIVEWKLSRMTDKAASILATILVINVPQFLLSVLYFATNGLCTCMALATEWSHFSYERAIRRRPRALRMSQATGRQRSSYFLQLPYKFAIPLMGISALLHWLISQSFFLVVVELYDNKGEWLRDKTVVTAGYSPLAMILVIAVGGVLLFAVVGASLFRIGTDMCMVGSCSAAISAACHVSNELDDEQREQLVQGPVVWGDVGVYDWEGDGIEDDNTEKQNARHCTFASAAGDYWAAKVGPPRPGVLYA